MTEKEYIAVFETWIGDQLARVEVPAERRALASREDRARLADVARASFLALDKRFDVARGRIKCVDILEVKPEGH